MKYNRNFKLAFLVGLGITFSGITYAVYKWMPKMPLKKYTEACLYIAVMDDEICRNELEGNTIGGKEIVFPSKRESLYYRYQLFLNSYRNYTPNNMKKEILKFEKRLEESKKSNKYQR